MANYKDIKLTVKKRKEGDKEPSFSTHEFFGRPLGSTSRLLKDDKGQSYIASVRIFESNYNSSIDREVQNYLVHVAYIEAGGIKKAGFVHNLSLNFEEIRSELIKSDLYPGPYFSDAVYEALESRNHSGQD